jgi:N-acetylglucosamine-6-sulfatase
MTSARTGASILCRGMGAALSALSVLAASATAEPRAARSAAKPLARPNVVLIVTDDQAAHTVRPDTMPNLYSLIAARGTSFTDSIVTTPLCCPSRASMLTGQYGHNNGVLKNDYRQLRHKRNTLPAWLHRAGYRTIHVGKYLNGYRKAPGPESSPAPGWDRWETIQEPIGYYDYDFSVNGRVTHFGPRDRDYVTNVLNRRASRLVRRYGPRTDPFYLQLDHWAPHNGSATGVGGACDAEFNPVPAPGEESLFATEPLPRPPSFDEEDVSDKPSFVRAHPRVDVSALERRYRCALASLRAVDRGIEQLHRALRKAGELNDTVIIFTSDNGFFYGEHRLRLKALPYEEALRVPLLVALPPQLRSDGSKSPTVEEAVANIDLAPTILEFAGARPCRKKQDCREMDGRSLVPLLQGREADWPHDRALVVEHAGGARRFSACSYRGIRVPQQIYVEHTMTFDPSAGACQPAFEVEHYDFGADPYQLENLYPADPKTPEAEQQEDLANRLATLRDCAGIAGRDPRQGSRASCE